MGDYTQPIPNFSFKEKQNAWLHRNNHNGETAWRFLGFNEKGEFTPNAENEYFISIGCFSRRLTYENYKEIEKIPEDDNNKAKWNRFENICKEELYGGKKPRYRHSLWRFLFEFSKDDILLVPGKYGDFHIFKIISNKVLYREEIKQISEFPEDKNHDLHYFWKVEPIRIRISRYSLADQALISRMKIRGTTSWLDDKLKKSIENAVKTEGKIQPGIIATESAKKAFWKSIQNNIDDNKFEKLIQWYFLKKGADSARILPKKTEGEKDADVEAAFETFRLKIYVQAKKHDNKVNLEKAYNQIKKYKEHLESVPTNDGYTNLYWIIYSSMKEQNAEILDSDDIRVISGDEFAEMLLDVGIADLDGAFFGK